MLSLNGTRVFKTFWGTRWSKHNIKNEYFVYSKLLHNVKQRITEILSDNSYFNEVIYNNIWHKKDY